MQRNNFTLIFLFQKHEQSVVLAIFMKALLERLKVDSLISFKNTKSSSKWDSALNGVCLT